MFHYNISRKKYFQTKLCTKYEKNDENLQKKVLHFTSTYNYILFYIYIYKIQIFIKIKFFKMNLWDNETFAIDCTYAIFSTYEFYLLCLWKRFQSVVFW